MSRRHFLAGVGAGAAVFCILAARPARAQVRHDAWTALLETYVVESPDGINRVRYARFKEEAGAVLDDYLASLQASRVSALGRAEQFAFWANLYNALTVRVILDHYPVASIRDINLGGGFFARGPWKKELVNVEGRSLSLDDIEHGILRRDFGDPRVHYALNCASIGCPNLQRQAFSGDRLEAMLDEGARAYVNHPRGLTVDGGRITASRIYDWFAEDFGDGTAIRRHWLAYAESGLASQLREADGVAGYAYDWGLNDAG
ncbi:DUF547 domain-containing protein [Stappia sp. F7233]|uniref:DUF547 domain-containing protein n=1 Tax=Stappia albiluteola TaxID=2758565 RepID=A0A839A9W8_9HYPH|nr:DUF547 domain-containing protein [Stappia albiluteola]MBA5776201.1 DUF547 domain-containing protein [Stappia albiluteola]